MKNYVYVIKVDDTYLYNFDMHDNIGLRFKKPRTTFSKDKWIGFSSKSDVESLAKRLNLENYEIKRKLKGALRK